MAGLGNVEIEMEEETKEIIKNLTKALNSLTGMQINQYQQFKERLISEVVAVSPELLEPAELEDTSAK